MHRPDIPPLRPRSIPAAIALNSAQWNGVILSVYVPKPAHQTDLQHPSSITRAPGQNSDHKKARLALQISSTSPPHPASMCNTVPGKGQPPSRDCARRPASPIKRRIHAKAKVRSRYAFRACLPPPPPLYPLPVCETGPGRACPAATACRLASAMDGQARTRRRPKCPK